MSVVLAAEHLTKTFVSLGRENYTAVDDVSFSVESGEKLDVYKRQVPGSLFES